MQVCIAQSMILLIAICLMVCFPCLPHIKHIKCNKAYYEQTITLLGVLTIGRAFYHESPGKRDSIVSASNSNQRALDSVASFFVKAPLLMKHFHHFIGEPRPPFQPKNSPLVLDNNMNSNGVEVPSNESATKENTPLRTHASTSRLLEKR